MIMININVYLLYDYWIKMKFHFSSLNDPFIHSVICYKSKNADLFLLSDTMRPILHRVY